LSSSLLLLLADQENDLNQLKKEEDIDTNNPYDSNTKSILCSNDGPFVHFHDY
jgi:hypothetical protein